MMLPGLKTVFSWNTLGGRKFVMVAGTMIFIGFCAVHSVTISKDYLDFIWKCLGIYCTANVGKDGVQALIAKLQGAAVAAPSTSSADNQALIAALTDTLSKLKATPSSSP